MDKTLLVSIAYFGLIVTGVLLFLAVIIKFTGGLFFARTSQQFKQDTKNPKFDLEKSVGNNFSIWIFKYIPPLFIGFFLILLISSIN